MTLLEKHRDDYKHLTKKELILIIKESLKRNKIKIDHNIYDPINSIRNNNRRSLRHFWSRRHNTKIRNNSNIKIIITFIG